MIASAAMGNNAAMLNLIVSPSTGSQATTRPGGLEIRATPDFQLGAMAL